MIGEFYDMIDSLQNRLEVRLFFKDLLSADEIASLMRRVEIAVLLSAKFNYDQITELIGVGRDKIAKVQKCLLQDEGGYKIIVKRLIENRKQHLKKLKHENKEPLIFPQRLKNAYKGHFLLFNLIDKAIEKMEDDKNLEKEALLFTLSAFSKNKIK